MRFFNTAGPVNPEDHYCLPPLERLDLDHVLSLIAQKKYFVLRAPRQTGKTSVLLALQDRLNRDGQYRCLYCNVEVAQGERENIPAAMAAILREMGRSARFFRPGDLLAEIIEEQLAERSMEGAFGEALSRWSVAEGTPAVLLVDEIDALIGDTLISVLRQIRAGYTRRPTGFPQSIVLCGVRDVRDYRIRSERDKAIITGGSAFNIKAESLRMGDFNRTELESLYGLHTQETGQVFTPEALDLAWELTQGQPWLVNALAYETCFRMKEGRDRTRPVTAEQMTEAKENLILRRETHLDQLADKLGEERVRRVILPLLTGGMMESSVPEDDKAYVLDLGLIRRGTDGLHIANSIYREVIPRQLSAAAQDNLEAVIRSEWYVGAAGRLDMPKLLEAFQQFFREHSEHWLEGMPYREAGPQLLLQAFLQRVVNGGGRVEREYGLGRGRTDLLVKWPVGGPGTSETAWQKIVLELKVLHKSLDKTIAEGLFQTRAYLDRCGAGEGHLVVFDRRPEVSWESKIFRREASDGGVPVTVWGM